MVGRGLRIPSNQEFAHDSEHMCYEESGSAGGPNTHPCQWMLTAEQTTGGLIAGVDNHSGMRKR
jgi:hypothetical protein